MRHGDLGMLLGLALHQVLEVLFHLAILAEPAPIRGEAQGRR
jgi:hypothetical protein